MPFPWLAAATIGSAAIGALSSRADQKRQMGHDSTRIRRTVADARAAGVHPLFALGGATGGSSQLPPTGNYVGNALTSLARQREQKGRDSKQSLVDQALVESSQASARLAGARADTVEWELANSINKRNEQNSNVQQDLIDIQPVTRNIPETGNPSKLPGVQPAWTKFQIYPDLIVDAPAEEISELFESPGMWPMVWEENKQAIKNWFRNASNRGIHKRNPAAWRAGAKFRHFMDRKRRESKQSGPRKWTRKIKRRNY